MNYNGEVWFYIDGIGTGRSRILPIYANRNRGELKYKEFYSSSSSREYFKKAIERVMARRAMYLLRQNSQLFKDVIEDRKRSFEEIKQEMLNRNTDYRPRWYGLVYEDGEITVKEIKEKKEKKAAFKSAPLKNGIHATEKIDVPRERDKRFRK